METFGEHLKRFALAVDIVSDRAFETIFHSVADYLKVSVNVEFCELLVPTTVEGEPGLKSLFHPGGEEWSRRIRDSKGDFQGQISYAFERREQLWIVAKSKRQLSQAEEYVNLLSHNGVQGVPLPKYVALTAKAMFTSVMFPLLDEGHRLALLNLESSEYLKPTRHLKEEFDHIADSLALLYALKKTYSTQSHNTDRAIHDLQQHKNTPLCGVHRVFLASSTKANDDVLGVIQDVLGMFEVEIEYWKDDVEAGDIPSHIWRKLSTSELGICYFSEANEANHALFVDNPNVLFEAGIMYALVHTSGVMRNWIPIREQNSPSMPFDFSSERAVVVPRRPDGRLNSERFRDELRRRFGAAQLPSKPLAAGHTNS